MTIKEKSSFRFLIRKDLLNVLGYEGRLYRLLKNVFVIKSFDLFLIWGLFPLSYYKAVQDGWRSHWFYSLTVRSQEIHYPDMENVVFLHSYVI